MEIINVLFFLHDVEQGGYIHYSEKESSEHSDSMTGKFILALDDVDLVEKSEIQFMAVEKRKLKKYKLVVINSSDKNHKSAISFVETEHGVFWFHLKHFDKYKGKIFHGLKMWELEPFSNSLLEKICLEKQFFFIGS